MVGTYTDSQESELRWKPGNRGLSLHEEGSWADNPHRLCLVAMPVPHHPSQSSNRLPLLQHQVHIKKKINKLQNSCFLKSLNSAFDQQKVIAMNVINIKPEQQSYNTINLVHKSEKKAEPVLGILKCVCHRIPVECEPCY